MDYIMHLIILISIFSMLGISLNLIVGYTGLLSLTHAAFYGIGAYTTAILLTKSGMGFFSSIILAVLLTLVTSFFVGIILSRLEGDYYALGTMGINTILFTIFLNWQQVTNGPLGIPAISKPEFLGINFTDNLNFLILVLIFFVIIYFISHYIVNSSFGRVLKAIREDETAIRIFGYNTFQYKQVIFIISAAMAAIAGSLFASYLSFIEPSSFTVTESIFILVIIILGGLANLHGSILGAMLLILLPEVLRFVNLPSDMAAQLRLVIYGVILILLMHFRPQGLMGKYKL